MPTVSKGKKQYQVVLDEDSEVQLTLLEWAQKRGLHPGKAIRCIIADWSDAINGKPNPFALAVAATAGTLAGQTTTVSASEKPMSAEEKKRQEALLQAAEQFL
jgi:hypothetical protein